MANPALEALYAKIPPVEGCRRGCTDCCGPAPVLPVEAKAIGAPVRFQRFGDAVVTPTVPGCFSCAFATASGCAIYDRRPMICRLYAAVDNPHLTCPHGARARHPLSDAKARALIDAAEALGSAGP